MTIINPNRIKNKISLDDGLGYENVFYPSVSTRAVIGQFSGPYSTVRPANI